MSTRAVPLGATDDDGRVVLARGTGPRGEVVLLRRGDHVELVVNGAFAMDTVDTSTEVLLARRALTSTRDPRRVLVGGLGLGFTARAVLGDFRVQRLDVVEIEEQLVAWARGGVDPALLPELAGLEDDPRCLLWTADVAAVLGGGAGSRAGMPCGPWDVVLLDVDNGPGFLVHEDNARLYAVEGLRSAVARVSPGGALVVWSSHRAPGLHGHLETLAAETGGRAEEVLLPVERDGRSFTYALYALHR